ncbi:Ribonuclease H-like superfamily, partial [Arabidopsis thaliana x Arabidopsis arenosa]
DEYEYGSDSEDGLVWHKDFVCMSVHFVDHTIKSVLVDYEIENKVSALLVSNYGDLGHEEFDCLRKWIEKRGKNPIDPCFFRIYCCADLFRLMAGDVFDNMDLLLEEIRVLVGWGKMTSTNWNVSLGNLQEALDMEDKNVFAEDGYYQEYDLPCDEDWIMIRTFCKLAGCIYKVAKELFEGEYSTSNVYFHLLAELRFMLKQELASADNDHFLCKANEILERFDKYWNDMFLVLATASVLDPRFKMKYLELYCSKKEVNDEGSKAETVLDYLHNLYAHYAAPDIPPATECLDTTVDSIFYSSEEEEEKESEEEESDEECGEEEGEDEEQKVKEEKKPGAYESFALFQEFLKFEGSSREFGESELDSYLKEPVRKWNKDFKALKWWKEESQNYPILSQVARDILSIPISRATSYDAYVADRRECPKFVASMKAELVNAMMCSKSWSRL